MKLPINKKFFEQIKKGEKKVDYRDAHITFVCEETGEILRKDVVGVKIIDKSQLPAELARSPMFIDDRIIVFKLK